MNMQAKPLFMIVETPLQAGGGNDLGIIDLPIQREKHTDFPKIESSSLRGSIRESFDRLDNYKFQGKVLSDAEAKEAIDLAFGPEEGDLHSAAVRFLDVRLLLFPVKSMKGIFAWVTCPMVLHKLSSDFYECGVKLDIHLPEAGTTPQGCGLFIKDNKLVLEEYTFAINKKDDKDCTDFAEWISTRAVPGDNSYKYWQDKMKRDIVVLSDDDFRGFVTMSTEFITRIKINPETGTAQQGGLFSEEYLPMESVLYSLIFTTPIFNSNKGIFKNSNKPEDEQVMDFFSSNLRSVIQLGANATNGKGLLTLKLDGAGGS
ncbi:type III-B CRISPR module RAMP protein Cmr4 [Dethiobacter alkaliphilus]|uniref:type III-B CRISPR module RAMP protein Cmr4 n=1 Tax=Dethiobacter alkaliphilus TaxID=427926 RepID=UPI002227C717|nr:type III-B CRISPR module RAMP protein Cmr4 [Dethiobacter alkaliphilus]MCW3488684.1 type III-B CRISPR module RAMP protein Cmr4 [Dethiobacter alkaliphilus]